MKNKTLILFLIVSPLLFTFSCKDDDHEDINIESNSMLAEFNFNEESDLNEWQFYSNDSAEMIIDTQDKIEGAGSLKIHNGCSSIINQNGIPISKESNYKINLHLKYTEMPDGQWCGGAYQLALVVIQGNESEWFSLSQDQSDWYEKEFHYHSDHTGLPIQLRIYNGVYDLWIDDFTIEKE